MTSNINYLSINENFPVAGEDNDTQTFRDNFDTIKTSLRAAQEEITTLQTNTAGLGLTETEEGSDFGGKEISNATLRDIIFKKFDGGIISSPTTTLTVDYENGLYQVFRFSSNMNIEFQNFPTNSAAGNPIGVGKVTLELYGDGTSRTLTLLTSGGTEFRKNAGFPGSVSVSSTTAPIIIEVWQHNSSNIFLNYLGQFS